MAQQNGQRNPQLRQRLQREHHVERREAREQKQRENFTRQPTPAQAAHQAKAAVNVEYSPVTRGIRQELANSRAQQQKGVQWYNQLGSELAGAAGQEEAGAAALGNTLTAQLAQANATNAATLAKQEAANAQFAATTGTPTATGQAGAAGNAQSALTGIALNAPIEANARNEAAYTRRLGLVQREQGHEYAQGQIGARKKIRQDLVAAQKQKGQAYVGRLAEERESARKQELDKKAFELEGQQTALGAQQEAEKLKQSEVQSQRSAATSRGNSERTAASSAASTAASQTSAEASARNAQVNAAEHAEERRYRRSHGGRSPAEVKEARKENRRTPVEKRERQEEYKSAYQTAKSVYNVISSSKEFQTLAPKEQWALLEQAIAKRGVEGPAVAWAVKKLREQSTAVGPGPGSTHR